MKTAGGPIKRTLAIQPPAGSDRPAVTVPYECVADEAQQLLHPLIGYQQSADLAVGEKSLRVHGHRRNVQNSIRREQDCPERQHSAFFFRLIVAGIAPAELDISRPGKFLL